MENDAQGLGVSGEDDKLAGAAVDRLGRLVLKCRLANDFQAHQLRRGPTYGTLLQLAVVAGLLHAVKQLLDQRGVLGLGPSGGLVLSGRHCGVGWLMVRMTRGSEVVLSPGFTAFARPGVGVGCRGKMRSRGTEKNCSSLARKKRFWGRNLWAVKNGRMGLGSTGARIT